MVEKGCMMLFVISIIVAFTDNDSRKWGTKLNGIPVVPVEEAVNMQIDLFVLTSAPGKDAITKQLISLGISEKCISSEFIDIQIESRIVFLKNLSEMQKKIDLDVQVAEAGVFEGDFAKYINRYYPDRKCHLFDTFEGFVKKDLEKENGRSEAVTGDYSNTSVAMVMDKMPYKDNVIIHKGFFPESAYDVEGKFCFVNLDLDLYEPTYQGLIFFKDRMTKGGVILVHDYYATNFKGPKDAVDKFLLENGKYNCFPIGDGISMMICGF